MVKHFLFVCIFIIISINISAQETEIPKEENVYKNSIYIGPGIFTKNSPDFLAFTGGFTKHLTEDLCVDFGFTIYNRLNKSINPPNPSIDALLLYNKSFNNNTFNVYGGGGITMNLFNAIGFSIKLKADHKVFNNFFLGTEVRYNINYFKIYNYPLIFMNMLLYFR